MHKGPVSSVAWSPDGKQVLTRSDDNTARIWKLRPAIEGTPARIALWVSVLTGLEADEAGAIPVLDAGAWRQRRQQLDQLGAWFKTCPLGGPPLP